MKVIYGFGKAATAKPTAIAIGIFDGVHRGHQQLIKRMLAQARRYGAVGTVITFFPHPAHVLRPQGKLPYLTSLDERLNLIKALGVSQCIVITFDVAFASISPEHFIRQQLVKHLKARSILVGEDFKFGVNRSGDIFLFARLAKECGYHFIGLPTVTAQGSPISSTRVRGLVTEGNLVEARRLLGRSFSLQGKVVKGDGRGRLLGFPTANIDYTADIVPPKGVYAVRVRHGKKTFPAVANLGVRPSFPSAKEGLHLEVHVLNAKLNLYGRILTVEFIRNIRNEKAFATVEALKEQIKKDILHAQKILS